MKTKTWLIGMVAVVFSLSISSQAVATGWSVGFESLQVFDARIDREIDVAVWYPTEADSQEEQVGPVTLQLALSAAPISDSKGVIFISHGFSGSLLGHSDTASYLASNGYVVVTPTHPDQPGLATGQAQFDPLVLRPQQIQFLLDELLAGNLFIGDLATENVGLIGFSLGAYTALRVVGAEPDLDALDTYCSSTSDALLCSTRAAQRFESLKDQLELQKDERVHAAILLAPAYGPLFTKASVSEVDIPLQIYSADQDEELNNVYHAEHFVALFEEQVEYKTIEKAGHYVFMSPCPAALVAELPALCEDPEGVNRTVVHEQLNQDIFDFFEFVFNN